MRKSSSFEPVLISAGQHREMLNPLLELLQLRSHHELAVMVENQSLCDLNSVLIKRLGQLLMLDKPKLLLVHGDTATAFAGAVAAFCERVPVAHIEAGLRSQSLDTPFPEEFHRYAIARIAKWHFTPTQAATRNLLAETC